MGNIENLVSLIKNFHQTKIKKKYVKSQEKHFKNICTVIWSVTLALVFLHEDKRQQRNRVEIVNTANYINIKRTF
jgi:signal recognition particle GTPase